MSIRRETIGTICVITEAFIWALFVLITNNATKTIPPLTFGAISTLLASITCFFYLAINGKLHELKQKAAYASLVMVTVCIIIIPKTLFFIGASKTSGLNSSVLLLSEMIFMLLFTPFIGEKNTSLKIIGAFGIFLGAFLIVFKGVTEINIGDLLIFFSTATYPIGNFYAKKAMNLVSPATILFTRFLLGGLFILMLAIFFEVEISGISIVFTDNWPVFLLTGLILLGTGTIIWYEGLKRLDISKAISLLMTFPLFSLILLTTIFKEPISLYQGIGVTIMMIGVYFSIKRQSTNPKLTKYNPEKT